MTERQHHYALDFYLVGEFTEDVVMRVLLFVQHLSKKGRWPAGKPEFVDDLDESSCTRPEDSPIRTVGGTVPLRDPRVGVSAQEDAEDLDSVRHVVEQLSAFTAALNLTVELQLGGLYVGRIENGRPDRLVAVGLLAEWARTLGGRQ